MIDKKKSIIRFTKDNQPTFRSNTIHSICQDSKGNLWVGTSDGVYSCTNNKLFIAKPENISFHGFFKEGGLTHNYVSGILPDENGALWMSTWKGIVKYEPSNTWLCQFTPYTFSDGLIDEKYNRNSIHWDRKTNTYYFGSVNGVNYFSPLKQTTSKIPHRVLISTMVLDDKPIHLFNQENMADSIIQVNANLEKKEIYFTFYCGRL
ncbi:two-component regulator propeller domain-containing protein [Saccharicrinis fermentans]|uniref:Response regulator containing a CheY-like receiver domain and a GGDEF domain protein n=1 Tax=Saccharicrinis fermentans DSM 9555 = JCM 21142 TaxID=869213 RepID=W7Y3X1_9BACT|nr:two-component regulator propeller domain-containing protein [Saccharicrinis fermentans]GAF02737.1 response regulator containing a CheY-like receiver domain and a GGDEF domain protein [Saccharicrinis fermentans DSM 9555 = JCM 21142]